MSSPVERTRVGVVPVLLASALSASAEENEQPRCGGRLNVDQPS